MCDSYNYYEQGHFISEMEWAPFKCLFWNVNYSVVKLMVFITSSVSLWYRPFYKNMLNYDNGNKCRKLTTTFSLIVEHILAFASVSNVIWEVKNFSPDFNQIAWLCFRHKIFMGMIWFYTRRDYVSLSETWHRT